MVRIKYRYFLINILFPETSSKLLSSKTAVPDLVQFNKPCPAALTSDLLRRTLRRAVQSTFGDYGAAALGNSLKVVYFSGATSTAIVRVSREHYRLLWATLTLVRSLPAGESNSAGSVPCVIRVVRVSGTIRKAEEEAVRRAKELMRRARDLGDGMEFLGEEVEMEKMVDSDGSEEEDEEDEEMDEDVMMESVNG